MKKAIVSVNVGHYDFPRPAPNIPGWDKVLFTDSHLTKANSNGWKVVMLEPEIDSTMLARKVKWLTHTFLEGYDRICWMDSNMTIKDSIPDEPFMIKHSTRSNIEQEAQILRMMYPWIINDLDRQLCDYKSEGYNDMGGLYSSGFFVRDITEKDNRFCEVVYEQLVRYQFRDQIAIPYVMWKLGYKTEIKNNILDFVRIHVHNIRRIKEDRYSDIHYITPYDPRGNIGLAYNNAIKNLNAKDDDWIVIRDGDTAFLTPNWGKQIAYVAHNTDYNLIGCWMGRTNRKEAMPWGFDDKMDMHENYEKARDIEQGYWGQVQPIEFVSGAFMMFRKKDWEEVGRFTEGTSAADSYFNQAMKQRGKKLGLIRGLYIFHAYRLWEKEYDKAIESHQHLIT